jgi:Na+/H+ antiporter NhaD/arsenite permease-like protein
LGLMWVITNNILQSDEQEVSERFKVARALRKVDIPSISFFLGILLAVSTLQSFGILKVLATFLSNTLKNDYLIGLRR